MHVVLPQGVAAANADEHSGAMEAARVVTSAEALIAVQTSSHCARTRLPRGGVVLMARAETVTSTGEGGGMKRLVAVSAVQRGLGVAGLRRALRDRTAYDIGIMRGSPEHIGRDQWVTGTNLSAPGIMLVLQGAWTARLLVRPDPGAARALGVVGAIMLGGYPVERSVRAAWRHWDAPIAPLTVSATVLAAAMAWWGLGATSAPQDSDHVSPRRRRR